MRIAVIGGDLRMITVCRLLSEQGQDCTLSGFENIPDAISELNTETDLSAAAKKAEAVILPLPFCKGGKLYAPFSNEAANAEAVLSLCESGAFVLGGGIGKGRNRFDYSTCESLLVKNAQITAEAALSIAMNELKTTLLGSKIIIAGYGRIGFFISEMCKSLGAKVFVAARRIEKRALAEASGICAVRFENMAELLSDADIVFNTVPSIVFGDRELYRANPKCKFIELASMPGGIDRESAKNCGIKIIEASGLPGKYAPISAGRAIFETVLPIITEMGVTI